MITALEDAEKRGIKTATIIVNSGDNICQLDIKEISVSDLTGCVFYIDGHEKGFIGWIKHNAK